MSMEPTARLAEFLVGLKYEDIPPSSLTATKRELLDILGTTLAGNLAPGCPEIISLVEEWGGAEESTLLGYGRKVTLDDYTEKAIKDPEVIALAQKVHPRVDEEIEKVSSREITPSILEVKTKMGKIHSQRIDIPKGHPRNPMSDEELAAKFIDCAHHAARPLKERNLNRLIQVVNNLEKLDDLSQLINILE